jgi:hypothetical protein
MAAGEESGERREQRGRVGGKEGGTRNALKL